MSFTGGISFRTEPCDADDGAVRAIVESAGFFTAAEVDVAVELVQERRLRGPASGYHFLFAESEGRTLGYTCFGPIACTVASFDLYWIAVHADARGGGLGRRLLDRTEREIAAMGGKRIYAETSSKPLYEPTRAFYERTAFVRQAFLPDFYDEGDGKVVYFKPAPAFERLV